jgi:hypothetical protein
MYKQKDEISQTKAINNYILLQMKVITAYVDYSPIA